MSVYRTHFYMTIDTLAHANSLKSSLDSIGTNVTFNDYKSEVAPNGTGTFQLDGDFHYDGTISKDIVVNWINANRSTFPMKDWIITGWVTWHKDGDFIGNPEKGEIYF